MKSLLNFDVLIDDFFSNISTDSSLFPIDKKKVLSLINDFENGKWRYSKFQSFIWDNIAETSLSYQERQSLIGASHSLLTASAQNLRLTDNQEGIGSGSELAEIVLYGIMKHYYKALPVVPKIFHKQNAQDNAKGADSVHIVLDEFNDFSVWFGEAKFYNSIEDARLSEIVQSVENSLTTTKLRKENSIITNVADIDHLVIDEIVRSNIKAALDRNNSTDNIKAKLHIPILLLHECSITKKTDCLSEDYKKEIIQYHQERAQSYFKKQLSKLNTLFKYSEISFHIILFPVPSKQHIVEAFVKNVTHYKSQDSDGDI